MTDIAMKAKVGIAALALAASASLVPITVAEAAPVQIQAPAAPLAPVTPVTPVSVDHQAQIDALSKQLADLQQSVKTSDSAQAN